MSAKPNRVIVVDGHELAYRAYYAIRQLSTSRGVPTNASYGFLRQLLEIMRRAPNDAVVVAFDSPAPTFRHEEFSDYKAHRPKAPADLHQQIATVKRLLDLMGVARLETPGLEGDDLIGSVAKRAEAAGLEAEVISGDRDALQLVSDLVTVNTPDGKNPIGPAEVLEKYGVTPDQWVDYRALIGDTSDNIPGVRGIGPVSARTLLQRYGSLDALLAQLDTVESSAQAQLIRDAGDTLELSRRLSTIVTDAPVPFEPDQWREREPRREELTELLRELEFGSVMRELGLGKQVEYRAADYAELRGRLGDEPWSYGFLLDDERPTAAHLTDLALAVGGEVAGAPNPLINQLTGTVNAPDAKALVVACGASAARGNTDTAGGNTAGAPLVPGDDPLLMAYLLDGVASNPEALSRRLGAGEWGADAASRAVVGAELLRILEPQLVGAQRRVYLEIERPLQAVLADMELAGVKLDAKLLTELSEQLGERSMALQERVRAIAEQPDFNVNSRDQVASLLFEKLGLQAGKRTATGKRSTAASALEPLKGSHEAVDLILEYREVDKLKGTYLDPLLNLADPRTGRVHTTFQQAVVATGRLSSVNPNLQNIPVRTPLGREVRRAFVADTGSLLVVADYSQIELRVLAHIADEPALLEAFAGGEDIHRATAATVYSVEPEAVSGDMRRAAKIINFGVLYGMSAQRLSRELEVPFPQAERFIGTYFERYPRVRHYIDETVARARESGYVETLLGRRRRIPELHSADRNVRDGAERVAYNMPIQGSAADIMKLAMLRLAPALLGHGGRLLLQVHDEVVAEVPIEAAEAAATEVATIMAAAYPLKVPLVVAVGVAPNWLEAAQ